MIRTPFANNIIPEDRIFNADGTYKNPLMALYSKMVPKPNQNFVEDGQRRLAISIRAASLTHQRVSSTGSGWTSIRRRRIASSSGRAVSPSSNIVSDWSYLAQDPALRIHSADRSRYQWSYTGTWTRTMGNTTLLDTSVATNRFNQIDEFRGLRNYKPTDVGLPSYLDEFCSGRGGCTLPSVSIGGFGGYQGFGGGLGDGDTATHIQAQSTISVNSWRPHPARRD